jgi:hypothetical protein
MTGVLDVRVFAPFFVRSLFRRAEIVIQPPAGVKARRDRGALQGSDIE